MIRTVVEHSTYVIQYLFIGGYENNLSTLIRLLSVYLGILFAYFVFIFLTQRDS